MDRPHLDEHANRTLAALAAATKGVAERSAELEAALCEYVAHLKREGLPPEQVVTRVKQALAQSGLEKKGNYADALVDGVVTLTIKRFYDAP